MKRHGRVTRRSRSGRPDAWSRCAPGALRLIVEHADITVMNLRMRAALVAAVSCVAASASPAASAAQPSITSVNAHVKKSERALTAAKKAVARRQRGVARRKLGLARREAIAAARSARAFADAAPSADAVRVLSTTAQFGDAMVVRLSELIATLPAGLQPAAAEELRRLVAVRIAVTTELGELAAGPDADVRQLALIALARLAETASTQATALTEALRTGDLTVRSRKRLQSAVDASVAGAGSALAALEAAVGSLPSELQTPAKTALSEAQALVPQLRTGIENVAPALDEALQVIGAQVQEALEKLETPSGSAGDGSLIGGLLNLFPSAGR